MRLRGGRKGNAQDALFRHTRDFAVMNDELAQEVRVMPQVRHQPQPVHIPGTNKGEEMVLHKGREPGRQQENTRNYRTARDSTGINARKRGPINAAMPSMPPA